LDVTQGEAARTGRVRRWRLIGSTTVAGEAVLVLVGAVALAVQAVTATGRSAGTASTANPRAVDLSLALVAVLFAAGLAWCARGLQSGRVWCRGPLATWQLIQLALAVQALRDRAAMPLPAGQRWLAGVVLLAAAVVTSVAVTRSGLTAVTAAAGARQPATRGPGASRSRNRVRPPR
jgi:hypothetical protein